MQVKKYIYINHRGDIVKISSQKEDAQYKGLVCVDFIVNIPDSYFIVPHFEINIDVPERNLETKEVNTSLEVWLTPKEEETTAINIEDLEPEIPF